MAAVPVNNPPTPTESKSAKKKKAMAESSGNVQSATIAENPGVTLDELVISRKINSDQKAQALNKPVLRWKLSLLEEQVVQCKKIDQDYRSRFANEKAELERQFAEKVETAREAAAT